jgi:uncharacterized YigZ family protein
MPKTIQSPVQTELIIKKSRFIAFLEPIDNQEQAKLRINDIRQMFPDARHVCIAYYVNGQSAMSDDGEPSGTAGKPMFNVLSHKKLENTLAVVVRYFGGIKLGAGGLTRAYGGAISQAVEIASIIQLENSVNFSLSFPFSLESDVRRVCDDHKTELENVRYTENVSGRLSVTESEANGLHQALRAVAPGNSNLVVLRED